MKEKITRDKARESANWVREHSNNPPFCQHSDILCGYIDQEPDADAMWDEIDTLTIKLSRQKDATHYVLRHSATKLFGVETGAGANTANVISLVYTLPQLLDKLREMDEPPVPTTLDETIASWEFLITPRTNSGITAIQPHVTRVTEFFAALRDKEKEKEEKEKN